MIQRKVLRRTLLKMGALATAISVGVASAPAQAETVTLRMSTWLPPQHHLVSDTLPAWFAAVEEASGGTLKIALDPAPIAKPPAQYDVVRDGAADMAYHVAGYTPGPFEVLRGIELPFLSPNGETGSQAVYDWYDRNIGFDKEFKDVKVVTIMVAGPGAVHSKKEIKSLEDITGVKLRVGGGGVRIAEALGAVPVALPSTQSYESIQKGVADGTMFPMEAVKGHRLFEVAKYHLQVPGGLYTTPFAIVMNRKKYESLSDEHKKVLNEVGGIAGARILGAGWDRADVAGTKAANDNGDTINVLSDGEVERWKEKLAVLNDDWIAHADSVGLDGKALLDDLKATIAKYSK
ncbi:TRAP transporter substrate-binding protein [Oricola thermophila]|uniref:TRAP transporter substrate-binding protein n=1 Tax=Oricola thermophila TaxID=2742145 RepID=A0A6N1VLS7_9HYPH|nr:TRAP transporter substrate-binding protein [Oricola thermophila]QKV20179.1 TRAP transporter substrate-binding protein [Oricola thermophila]